MFLFVYLTILIFFLTTSTLRGQCPDAMRFQDNCYTLHNTPAMFTDAHKACQTDGGILAKIDNQETITFLLNTFPGAANSWIGIHDQNRDGIYVNMLNERQTFLPWQTVPNLAWQWDCVFLYVYGKIQGGTCSAFNKYFCSKAAKNVTETTDISTVSAVTVWKTTQTISDITSEIHSSLEATTLAENSTHLLNIPSLNTNSATTESYDTTLLTKNQSSSTNQLLSTTEAGSTIPENPSTIIVSNTNSLSSTNPSSSGSTNPTSTSSTNPNSTMATNPDTSLEGCQCPCSRAASLNNTEELNTRIKKLRKELEVNIVKLSSFIRTKTSAPDNRISSVFIGSVFGVFFITSAILLIVLSDLTLLIRQIRYGP